MAGPQCSRVCAGRPATACATVVMPASTGMPRSSLARTSALAASIRSAWIPYSRLSAATAAGWPPAGTRQSTETTGAPCSRIASPNSGRPTLTTPTRDGSDRDGVISRSVHREPGVLARGAAAGGGYQRVLGGPVSLPPALCLVGQLAGLRRGLVGHPDHLVRSGAAESGPAHHDLPRI